MFCDICLKAFSANRIPWRVPKEAKFDTYQSWWESFQWIPHHPTFSSLKESVDLDCSICTGFRIRQDKLSLIAQLEIEGSLSSSPDGGNVQQGTRLGIATFNTPNKEMAEGQSHRVYHSVIVNGYPPNDTFNMDSNILFLPIGI